MAVRWESRIGGLVFVACMFVGADIGLFFGRPDVGGCLGMGIGFLIMAFLRAKGVKSSPMALTLPTSLGRIILCAIGALIVAAGVCLLYNPALLYPYLAGIGAVVIGLLVLLTNFIEHGK